jgi:ferredoxin-NADP reductase
MPAPWAVTQPLDREAGIRRRAMLEPAEYRARLARGDTADLVPAPPERGEPPVIPVLLARRDDLAPDLMLLEFRDPEGRDLPHWEAGAHVDVVVAPEYQRQYYLTGAPADRSRYRLGVQREASGRGGSALMHRAFREGRRVFVSRPRNHFPLTRQPPSRS